MATQDVELVEYFFAHTIAPALVAILVPAAVMGTLLAYGWPMAVALAPFIAIVALSPFFLRKRLDRLGGRAREVLGLLNAHAVDTIQGLTELLAFRQEAARRRVFLDFVRDHHRLRLPYYRDLTAQMALIETATGLGGLAVVLAGTAWITAGWLEAAMLPLLAILAMATFLPVSEIAHIGRQLADTLGATRRLHAVHSAPVTVRDGPGAGPAPGAPALQMEGVDFTYVGTKRPALSDVTLAVRPGETLALVGPSGAGKTTIAHLFMRFWDPAAGTVRLDGADVRDWTLDELRARIALVAQDTYLFNDTLRANILVARPDASDDQIAEAVRPRRAWTTSSLRCRKGWRPASASAARGSPAASASASRSPAPSSRTRRS